MNAKELIERYQAGERDFSCPGSNLRNADFTGLNIDELDLRGADLRNTNFDGTTLTLFYHSRQRKNGNPNNLAD